MPNRENLRVASTRAPRSGASAAEGWVFIAFCVAGFVAMVFLVFLSSSAHAAEIFPRVCLDREVATLTLIEDHAMAEDKAADALSGAYSDLLDARALCYAGKTADGGSAYDAVARRLGPLRIGRK